MKVRHAPPEVDPRGASRDTRWISALVLGVLAVVTVAITGSPDDVPMVLGPALLALGVYPRPTSS